jgi:hypothetical protein
VRKVVVLIAATTMVMSAMNGLSAVQRPQDPPRQHGSFVVAAAEESRQAAPARVPVGAPSDVHDPIAGTLPLLLVGSLLIGLAAAVRRTT